MGEHGVSQHYTCDKHDQLHGENGRIVRLQNSSMYLSAHCSSSPQERPNDRALSCLADCARLGSVYLTRRRRTYRRKHLAEGQVSLALCWSVNNLAFFFKLLFTSTGFLPFYVANWCIIGYKVCCYDSGYHKERYKTGYYI
jgi:hypothetical protein